MSAWIHCDVVGCEARVEAGLDWRTDPIVVAKHFNICPKHEIPHLKPPKGE